MKCTECKEGTLAKGMESAKVSVDGHSFISKIPAMKCQSCGEVFYDALGLANLEVNAAAILAKHGVMSSKIFAFQRKAIGLASKDLAKLLNVTPEHLSRWEHGKAIDRNAAAVLGALVEDAMKGVGETLDRLHALQKPRSLPKVVRVAQWDRKRPLGVPGSGKGQQRASTR